MAKKNAKNASSELITTLPVGVGQANAIMRIADAHRDLIDLIDDQLPSGTLRDRALQSQQESFLFARMSIENNPRSFPDPKPVKIVDDPEDPFASDDEADQGDDGSDDDQKEGGGEADELDEDTD